MRKIFLAAVLVASLAAIAVAQNSNKYEGFGGFSVASLDVGLTNPAIVGGQDRETSWGFDTSATGYLSDHVGIEGNIDGHFKKKTFGFPSFGRVDGRLASFNFLVGPHYRFSSSGRVTPFVRALGGGNHSQLTDGPFTIGALTESNVTVKETDWALKLGGGVDIGWTKRAAVRLSADYNPIFQRSFGALNPDFPDRRTRNDAVFSVGILLK